MNSLHGSGQPRSTAKHVRFVGGQNRSDPTPEGVSVGNYLQIGVLGYADDATLASKSITDLSQRLTSIKRAWWCTQASKTKTMHVEAQAALPIPTKEQVQATHVR